MSSIKFHPELMTGRLSYRDTKRYFSLFGWFAFAYFLITNLSQTAIMLAVQHFFPNVFSHWSFWELLSFIPNYCIGLPIALLFFLRKLPRDVPAGEKMSFGNWWGGFCVCMTLMMAGNYVSQIFLSLIQSYLGPAPQNPVESAVSSMPPWATFLFVVLLAPLREELVFRGLICRRLLPLGEGWAIVLSSAFFALFHGNFYQVFYAFTLGCFFSFIYLKTGKLVYTVLFHMAVNFVGGFLSSVLYELIDMEVFYPRLQEFLINPALSGITASDLLSLLWFGVYMLFQGIILACAVLGIVLLVKGRKKLRISAGLLPPAHEAGRGLFTSSGIIASIVLFSLVLAISVIPT